MRNLALVVGGLLVGCSLLWSGLGNAAVNCTYGEGGWTCDVTAAGKITEDSDVCWEMKTTCKDGLVLSQYACRSVPPAGMQVRILDTEDKGYPAKLRAFGTVCLPEKTVVKVIPPSRMPMD